jgi:membrane AbrB-like protein
MSRLRVGNAWIIGPLAVSIPLTAAGIELSAMPREVANLGQLLLGSALGGRFEREFVHAAPRFLAAVALSVVVSMLVCAGFGLVLTVVTGLHWATLVLSTAPGGIAEMALTAKVLELGVPIVTAFHVTRMVMLVTLTGPAYRVLSRQRSDQREI